MGPDQGELYSAFWHSAIRVKDPEIGIDQIYNYGIFDFDNPNFYTDFAKGHLLYRLGSSSFDRFFNYYVYSNRSVEEQILNLSQDQRQYMFEYLEHNNLPENRYYLYNYLFDNCATKIRDVVVDATQGQARFDSTYVPGGMSFRQLIDECTEYQPWGDFGIDLGLGSKIDRIAKPYEYMFLPYYVRDAVASATIITQQGAQPLAAETKTLFSPLDQNPSRTIFTPGLVLWAMFIVILVISFRGSHRLIWLTDLLLFGAVGLMGLVLALIWFATDHVLAANNYNLIWMTPLNLVVLPWVILGKRPKLFTFYFLAYFVVLSLLVVTWLWLPQELPPAALPLVLILAIRSFFNYTGSRPFKAGRSATTEGLTFK